MENRPSTLQSVNPNHRWAVLVQYHLRRVLSVHFDIHPQICQSNQTATLLAKESKVPLLFTWWPSVHSQLCQSKSTPNTPPKPGGWLGGLEEDKTISHNRDSKYTCSTWEYLCALTRRRIIEEEKIMNGLTSQLRSRCTLALDLRHIDLCAHYVQQPRYVTLTIGLLVRKF